MTREQSADVTSATVKRSVQRQPKEQQPRSSKSKVVCATEAGLAVDMLPLRPNRVSLAARNLNIRKPLQELSWPRAVLRRQISLIRNSALHTCSRRTRPLGPSPAL